MAILEILLLFLFFYVFPNYHMKIDNVSFLSSSNQEILSFGHNHTVDLEKITMGCVDRLVHEYA